MFMDIEASDSASYCASLVKADDEDRWLAAQYAPQEARRRLLALYALMVEVRRVRGAVSEPGLGEIRLRWWRDALEELTSGQVARAHPVVEELALLGETFTASIDSLDAAIDKHAHLLYGADFGSVDAFAEWIRAASGAFDACAARLLGADDTLAQVAAHAGTAFAMAREGMIIAPTLTNALPDKVHLLLSETPKELSTAPPQVAPAILHLALTRRYVRQGVKPFPMMKRLIMVRAMLMV